jgi:hypothetical protein
MYAAPDHERHPAAGDKDAVYLAKHGRSIGKKL